jgi:hypothetical protein
MRQARTAGAAPAVAWLTVRTSVLEDAARVESLPVLSHFRSDSCDCLTARADALF